MASATFTITGWGGSITLTLDEAGPSETSSPTPTTFQKSGKTGIVTHSIIARDGDKGQDMRPYSPDLTLEGLSLNDVRGQIDSLLLANQLTQDGLGVITVTGTASDGTQLINQAHLALVSASYRSVGGTRKWFRYILNFREFK